DNIMEGISTPATLFYETATGATRRVLPYGEGGAPYAPAILACSSKSDRAVIRGSSSGAVSGPIVVRLSDGQLISQGSRGPYRGGNGVLVSMDGTLLALGSTDGISVPGKDAFTVFGLPSNNVVAEFIGKRIEAFSADGTRILTVEDVGSTNEQRRYQLVDLATSRSLWTSPVLRPATVL